MLFHLKKLATEHFIKNNKTKLRVLLFLDDLYSPLTVLRLNILKIGCNYMKEYKNIKTSVIHVIKN